MNLDQLAKVFETETETETVYNVKYNPKNAKLKKLFKAIDDILRINVDGFEAVLDVVSFDLPAGWACPQANECQSRMTPKGDGKWGIVDGKNTIFRCYAASAEQYPNVRNGRHSNMLAIRKTLKSAIANGVDPVLALADLLESAIPQNAKVVRVHTSGDFFHRFYFLAWLEVARRNQSRIFYAYTKALKLWIDNMKAVNALDNFRLTASRGGTQDSLIDQHGLPESVVCLSEAEAVEKGLPIDTDDSHAFHQDGKTSFALIIHGTQPKGSEASKAWQAIKTANKKSKA